MENDLGVAVYTYLPPPCWEWPVSSEKQEAWQTLQTILFTDILSHGNW